MLRLRPKHLPSDTHWWLEIRPFRENWQDRYRSNKSLPIQQQEELRDARSHRWRGGHWRILRRQDAASRPRHHLSGAAAPASELAAAGLVIKSPNGDVTLKNP